MSVPGVNTVTMVIVGVPLLCLVVVTGLLIVGTAQSLAVGARKRESWPAFASHIGGEFHPAGGGQPDWVEATIDGWPLYLDSYLTGGGGRLVNYTRMRAFYPPRRAFEVTIYTPDAREQTPTEHGLTPMSAASLGLATGVQVFTSEPAAVHRWLSNPVLAEKVNTLKPLDPRVRRRRDWKGGGVSSAVHEVVVRQSGIVTDGATLHAMYGLIELSLRLLAEAGAAGKSFAETC